MSKLVWDKNGERYYETGVKNGVLYPFNGTAYTGGVVWNGLSGVSESPSGAESNPIYADDMKYLNLISAEDYGMTIEAYSSPEAFDECDGTASPIDGITIGQQTRKTFGFSYRTSIGNDTIGQDYGYKLHLVWGCLAAPSSRDYATINDSPEAITLSWEISTTPVPVSGYKATAKMTIDSTKIDPYKLKKLEAVLYGSDAEAFSAEKTYAIGDTCTHTESEKVKTYICKTAIETAGEWDATDWEEIPAGPALPLPDEIITLVSDPAEE